MTRRSLAPLRARLAGRSRTTVRVDLPGIWLEVLAVSLHRQHSGAGRAAYALTVEHLRTIGREGDQLAGLVHIDNHRSKRLLTDVGWTDVALVNGHELWVGAL